MRAFKILSENKAYIPIATPSTPRLKAKVNLTNCLKIVSVLVTLRDNLLGNLALDAKTLRSVHVWWLVQI